MATKWVRLVAAVAAIAVVAGGAWWLIGPWASPPAGACAASEPADLPAAEIIFEPTIGWQPAELPEAVTNDDEQVMLAVSPLDHGWLASGSTSTGPDTHGFMLRSPDGMEWRSDPDDAGSSRMPRSA